MVLTIKDIDDNFESFVSKLDSSFNKKEILRAYEFSKKAHLGQKRRNGDPYISHPVEVSKIVVDFGLDETALISALLHDVVEDTNITINIIKVEFGQKVAEIVESLTKINFFVNSKKTANIEALRKILLASVRDIRILVIKLCDRLHNMRTLKDLDSQRRDRISKETLLIYVPIAQKLGMYSLKWELEDLSFKFENPTLYKFLKEKINMKRSEREKVLEKVVLEIENKIKKAGAKKVSILGRPKNFYSIYKKIKNKSKAFEEIHDLYAVRIITDSIGECYNILGILHENFQVYPNRLKDYIANPKSNGYQSIHSLIFSKDINSPVEVQIRTEKMHHLAEFGVAAHWKYKNLGDDGKFERKIGWLREVMLWEKEHENSDDFLKLLRFNFFEDEIFVFSPKNDLYTIPKGSCVLDFAYAVHSEIGAHAFRAKVNGVISTLDKKLKSGDIIEIISNKNVRPSEKWLKYVKTPRAKTRIRHSLNLKFNTEHKNQIQELFFEKVRNKISRNEEFKKMRKAGCCDVTYEKPIVGVLSRDKKELVIHSNSCENAKYSINTKIALFWKEEKNKKIDLQILTRDRYGIIIDFMNIFSLENIQVSKFNSKVLKDSSVKTVVEIFQRDDLDKIVEKVKKIEGVEQVKISRRLFG